MDAFAAAAGILKPDDLEESDKSRPSSWADFFLAADAIPPLGSMVVVL